MKNTQDVKHLTQQQIEALLKGPEKCLEEFEAKVKISNSDKVKLRKSLEQFVALHIGKEEFKNADELNDFICQIENIDFYEDDEDEYFIYYSFQRSLQANPCKLIDSGFIKIPK